MYCPNCDDKPEVPEMMELRSYDGETGKMEVTMECANPECPVKFLGVLYKTTKAVAVNS